MSPPFPKRFPRGGGIYDQDPLLMRDFRAIRKFELDWKEGERQRQEASSKLGSLGNSPMKGGGLNLEELLDQLTEES